MQDQSKAIDEYNGGVIIISHNKEFANAVSQEKWIMEKGNLRKEGESVDKNAAEATKKSKYYIDLARYAANKAILLNNE